MTSALGLVPLPILLVLVTLVDQVTLLLQLIMVDVEGAILQGDLGVLDLGCDIWCLKTNKSEWSLTFFRKQLH